jgi:hypothetical protein
MAENIFSKILNDAKSKGFTNERDATEWLRQKARNTSNADPKKIINSATVTNTNLRSGIGQMFLFGYKPKYAKELKYYDTFPLIFPFKIVPNGFYGINMHYLPYVLRARLMDALYTTANNNKLDNTTKLRISYDILNSSAQYKYFKPCVKHYLNNHIASKFMYISPSEWNIALFLPIERFQKASKATVWKESVQQIGSP